MINFAWALRNLVTCGPVIYMVATHKLKIAIIHLIQEDTLKETKCNKCFHIFSCQAWKTFITF
jgi:hypothetical protein